MLKPGDLVRVRESAVDANSVTRAWVGDGGWLWTVLRKRDPSDTDRGWYCQSLALGPVVFGVDSERTYWFFEAELEQVNEAG